MSTVIIYLPSSSSVAIAGWFYHFPFLSKFCVSFDLNNELDDNTLTPLATLREQFFTKQRRGPPSTMGKPVEFAAVQKDPVTYYACARPPDRESKLPLNLLDPVFAEFVDNCRSVIPTEKAYECARELRMEMGKFYADELKRAQKLREILQTGGFEIRSEKIKDSKIETDGHILCQSNPTIIIEVKDEIGSAGAEPSLQSLLYYETFVRLYDLWKDMSSIHSCLIITLVGEPTPDVILPFRYLTCT